MYLQVCFEFTFCGTPVDNPLRQTFADLLPTCYRRTQLDGSMYRMEVHGILALDRLARTRFVCRPLRACRCALFVHRSTAGRLFFNDDLAQDFEDLEDREDCSSILRLRRFTVTRYTWTVDGVETVIFTAFPMQTQEWICYPTDSFCVYKSFLAAAIARSIAPRWRKCPCVTPVRA
jgi:hypothetical protein